MKVRLKSILIIILVAMISISFTGCDFELPFGDISTTESYFETEYFMCCYDINGEVIIGGITDEALKLDTIIIPTEINGKKVASIGYPYGHKNHFSSSSYSKLYIPPNVKYGRGSLFTSCKIDLIVILLSVEPNRRDWDNRASFSGLFSTPNIFIPLNAGEAYEEAIGHIPDSAPVSYMNNYDDTINGGYHWIDVYDDDGSLIEPPVPEREGYDFGGWYEEAECTGTLKRTDCLNRRRHWKNFMQGMKLKKISG
ncbi:MAG: InlB B-repeat-containing protein [Clostridia bacterium]|nr:InlB B-repeat-containing protein [Clostridia bacterium]